MADLIPRAQTLRRSMTPAERKIWRLLSLRQGGVKFRRQAVIGEYIVDFVCFEKKLVIEIDGGQHAEQGEYDEARTAWLKGRGYRVIRYWNNEVLGDIEAVKKAIYAAIENGSFPPPYPPPQGGR